jgi:hypothetical protein
MQLKSIDYYLAIKQFSDRSVMTLSIKINGTLYKILPQTTKIITLQPGKMTYYGWSPGIRPARGSSMLAKGKKYAWQFKINRR